MLPTPWLTVAALTAVLAALMYLDRGYNFVPLYMPDGTGSVYPVDGSLIPNPIKREGVFAPNTLLQKASRLFDGEIESPETIALAADGTFYTVDKKNYLRRGVLNKKHKSLEEKPLLHLGNGTALGIEIDHHGDLIICIPAQGLIKVHVKTMTKEVLASHVSDGGSFLGYAEDIAISKNGTIFFTDAFDRSPQAPEYDSFAPIPAAVMQASQSGRLLSYDPATKTVRELARGFWMANGCALSKDESFILVADTFSIRITKYFLTGPKAGTTEKLLDGLPGVPDNLRTAADGTFWTALSGARLDPIYPYLYSRYARWLISWLSSGGIEAVSYGAIIQFDKDGKILRFLEDPDGSKLAFTTAVTEGEDGLYIGSFRSPYVGFVPNEALPEVLSTT